MSSVISGMAGMGGGILLLASISPLFAPSVVIPLHGTIQLSSNISRVVLSNRNVHWKLTSLFVFGSAIGAFAGSQLLVRVPSGKLQCILAIAILVMTWMPDLKNVPILPGQFVIVGALASFLSLFVGAVGPLTAPFFLRANLTKESFVATKASCQIPVHLFKVLAYFATGFVLTPWLKVLAVVIPFVFLGTWLGKLLLGKVPEEHFTWLIKVGITLLVGRMLLKTVI
ncbi:MAG: sulfite exporter TauE/SafE family protein [bacterium]|nr:sulfite exporter TauE/SafE family protein [bacterium]